MPYMEDKVISSWVRHLLSLVAPTLSLKSPYYGDFACVRSDCALLTWHARLRFPSSALFQQKAPLVGVLFVGADDGNRTHTISLEG